MNRTGNWALPRDYAGIDLGNGSFVEITDSAVNIRQTSGYPRSNGSTSQSVNRIAELADHLRLSRATPDEIDRAAVGANQRNLDDRAIELLVGRGAELVPRDRQSAYYLLRLTYDLARRHATFWKHALVSSILGFLVLYDRQSPTEAISIFQDLDTVGGILGAYLGCSENARGLCQLARRGLQDARTSLGAQDPAAGAEPDLDGQVWSAIRNYSRAAEASQFFMQSEAFARGSLLLRNQSAESAADELCEMGKRYLLAFERKDCSVPPEAIFPVITLDEVLAEHGAKTQALELLEQVEASGADTSPSLETLVGNRIASVELALDHPNVAQRILDSIPAEGLASLSGNSVSTQGELLTYSLNQAQASNAQQHELAARRWTKEAARQLQSMEQWSQVASCTRRDDLRLLYCAELRNAAREGFARLRSLL